MVTWAHMGSRRVKNRQQIRGEDLDLLFGAIRDALERGDVDAARRAWIDLGVLFGIDVQDALNRP